VDVNTAAGAAAGRAVRVNGPLVDVEGLAGTVALLDVVEVGETGLQGEVVALAEELAVVQVYEYTGGIGPGAPVRAQGRPLSAALGPWLLGGVFDGLLRPLLGGPERLAPGALGRVTGRWRVEPRAQVGRTVTSGAVLATAKDARGDVHAVPVPAGRAGTVDWVAVAGDYGPDDPIASVEGIPVTLTEQWPVRQPRPHAGRLDTPVPLVTGQRVLDLLEPVAKGSTAAVLGGFGTGKTVLLQQIAKWCDAEVIVYVGCGERGNELADAMDELRSLEDPHTGRALWERTVIIANTSNMPVMAREASIYTAMTVAEYFRDQGRDVALIADSTSRWAEALREFASRSGELPAEEGYPASLPTALAAFYERAGRVRTLAGQEGSVTVIAAVSPPGGDFTEPVSAHTQRFVRTVWTLDRDLAYARHYPAVTWRASFARDADALAIWHVAHGDSTWPDRRARIAGLLADADRLQPIAELVGMSALPGRERVVLLTGRLIRDAVLQQSALSPNDAYAAPQKQAALADAILAVHDRCLELIGQGFPASLLEEVDFSPLVRARDEAGPADVDTVTKQRDLVLDALPRP
jgi:V/A-type H+-transporting ATPase subunit A